MYGCQSVDLCVMLNAPHLHSSHDQISPNPQHTNDRNSFFSQMTVSCVGGAMDQNSSRFFVHPSFKQRERSQFALPLVQSGDTIMHKRPAQIARSLRAFRNAHRLRLLRYVRIAPRACTHKSDLPNAPCSISASDPSPDMAAGGLRAKL